MDGVGVGNVAGVADGAESGGGVLQENHSAGDLVDIGAVGPEFPAEVESGGRDERHRGAGGGEDAEGVQFKHGVAGFHGKSLAASVVAPLFPCQAVLLTQQVTQQGMGDNGWPPRIPQPYCAGGGGVLPFAPDGFPPARIFKPFSVIP